MFYFNMETDPACVPYLSDEYIDTFCNDLIRRFDPGVISQLHPVNIEQFIQKFLGLRLVFENLSCDGSVLGATLFSDTDEMPVYDPKRHRARYITAREGTVFADCSLTKLGKNNRYRFTLAHEAGHALWHSMYLRARLKAGRQKRTYLACDTESVRLCGRKPGEAKLSGHRLIEYQANRSASALLMPRDAIIKLIAPMGECLSRADAEDRIIYTASTFRVSDAAAKIRLSDLGLIDPDKLRVPSRRLFTA